MALEEVLLALPLSLLFLVVTFMTMSAAEARLQPAAVANDIAPPPPATPVTATPPLLLRLKPENRGALLHLSVEDHYTKVVTSRGREMILLRFADAIGETGSTEGLQVHRSHWVARSHVSTIASNQGRLQIRLEDGTEIPVSRSHAAKVRAEWM